MTEYYQMEPVRDHIIAEEYSLIKALDNPVPLDTWIKHPCKDVKICVKTDCDGYISICVEIGKMREWIYLEIRYLKIKQRAFIRADNTQMQRLISIGIFTYESLEDYIEKF